MKENRWLLVGGWGRNLLISYGVTVVWILGLSLLMYRCKGSGPAWDWSAYTIYFASCGVGGFLTGRKMGTKRLLWGMLHSILYVVVLGVLSWSLGNGWQGDLQHTMTVIGMCLAGSVLGAIVS